MFDWKSDIISNKNPQRTKWHAGVVNIIKDYERLREYMI